MKCVLIFCVIFGVFAFSADAVQERDRVQVYGQRSPTSFLIADEPVFWHGVGGNVQMRRWLRFPYSSQDEGRVPRIGAVVIILTRTEPNTQANLSWGGPGHRYAGVEFLSGPGEGIDARVEIWSV